VHSADSRLHKMLPSLQDLQTSLLTAFRLHRGDGDVDAVLVCFILFITIGLLQHISNIARMMQQYTQHRLREALEQAQNNAKGS
jgi:hypothetical protein